MSCKNFCNKNGEEILQIPDEYRDNKAVGFVYRLNFDANKYYIGKKACWMRKTSPRLVSGLERDGHIQWSKDRQRERYWHEDWQNYNGSGYDYDPKLITSKVILAWCTSRLALTYFETLLIMQNLYDPYCLNGNCMGKYYKSACIDKNIHIIS